jgi:hypothetical protein
MILATPLTANRPGWIRKSVRKPEPKHGTQRLVEGRWAAAAQTDRNQVLWPVRPNDTETVAQDWGRAGVPLRGP